MKRVILLATVALVMSAMLAMAGPALATHVPFHEHELATPGQGDPNVAQGLCENKNHAAFSNFHSNVHQEAPGLHNNGQVRIMFAGVC